MDFMNNYITFPSFIESKTNINLPIQKIRTSHYSARMLWLLPIILARKVVVRAVDLVKILFNPPKMPTLGGLLKPLEPSPHPMGLVPQSLVTMLNNY